MLSISAGYTSIMESFFLWHYAQCIWSNHWDEAGMRAFLNFFVTISSKRIENAYNLCNIIVIRNTLCNKAVSQIDIWCFRLLNWKCTFVSEASIYHICSPHQLSELASLLLEGFSQKLTGQSWANVKFCAFPNRREVPIHHLNVHLWEVTKQPRRCSGYEYY